MTSDVQVFQSLCKMCNDRCGINVYMRDGKVIDIDGYEKHCWSKGRTCIKAKAGVDWINHKDRITYPLKKTEKGWQRISLEKALDEIAEKIKQIQAKYGPHAMSVYKGDGTGYNEQEALAKRFCRAMGSVNYLSADSVCYASRHIGYFAGFGTWQIDTDQPNADCIMLWGACPPGGHPLMTERIMQGKEKGAKLIVVDPRLSYIALQADLHLPIRVGTDGALAWGIIHLLIENNHLDHQFIKDQTIGFDAVKEYAERFTPEAVAEETGLRVQDIYAAEKYISAAGSAFASYIGHAVEDCYNGNNNIRAISYIDALCGNIDREGGNLLTEYLPKNSLFSADEKDDPFDDVLRADDNQFPLMYYYRKEVNTMTAFKNIIVGKPNAPKGIILTAGNPVMTNPHTDNVIKALSSLELFVVRDLFMTETAELADYILPAESYLERSELHTYAEFQSVCITKQLFTIPECQTEYQMWHDLAHRLGFGEAFPWKDQDVLNDWLLKPTGITREDLFNHPEGIVYKEKTLEKWRSKGFDTLSGKVEFTPTILSRFGYDPLAVYISPDFGVNKDADYPFVLITGARHPLFVHSRYHNVERLRQARPQPFLEMHPDDAKRMGISDGEKVRVISKQGKVQVSVQIMEPNQILLGNLQLTDSWKEASANILTTDDILDPVSGFPIYKGVPVRVEKI